MLLNIGDTDWIKKELYHRFGYLSCTVLIFDGLRQGYVLRKNEISRRTDFGLVIRKVLDYLTNFDLDRAAVAGARAMLNILPGFSSTIGSNLVILVIHSPTTHLVPYAPLRSTQKDHLPSSACFPPHLSPDCLPLPSPAASPLGEVTTVESLRRC